MGFIAFVKDCFGTLCDALGPKGTKPRDPDPFDIPIPPGHLANYGDAGLKEMLRQERERNMVELLRVTLRDNLLQAAKVTPLVTVDGKPNPKWVEKFGMAFPSLSEELVRAKLEELITDEEYIIEEFLGGPAHHMPNWEEEINPEVRAEDGSLYVCINGKWLVMAGTSGLLI